MLISHTHRLIFFKSVKTGGTSVEVALEKLLFPHIPARDKSAPYEGDEGIIGSRGEGASKRLYWHHMPAIDVYNLIGCVKFNDYRKITIVRNPFDKAVSWFFFTVSKQTTLQYDRIKFNNFIKRGAKLPNDRRIYTIENEICCNNILRYETLQQDDESIIKLLCLNVDPIPQLPRLKTKTRLIRISYQEYYDEESINIIREIYSYECETFDYRF